MDPALLIISSTIPVWTEEGEQAPPSQSQRKHVIPGQQREQLQTFMDAYYYHTNLHQFQEDGYRYEDCTLNHLFKLAVSILDSL